MAGGLGPGQFDDPRLAEALRAGDAIALTKVYDTYAPFLFDYCHGLLRDRVEAGGALRSCLVAAREHVGGLRDPERLRGWLYAIARKECMRRRDSPTRHTGQEAPEADDDDLSEEQVARRAERRLLAHSVLAALSGRQREAIDLSVRHELAATDLAGIFGIAPAEAERLLETTHDDLSEAVHAALVAQMHRDDCPSVAALTGSWPLSPHEAGTLVRHVASCPTCSGQDVPPLPADRLLAVLPIAAIPADLRLEALDAATNPDRAESRYAIAALAEPFDAQGWPLPYQPNPAKTAGDGRGKGRVLAAVGGGVAAIALIAASMTILGSGGDAGTNSAAPGPVPVTSGTSPAGEPLPEDSPTESRQPSPSASPTSKTPSPSASASPSETPTTKPPTTAPSRPKPPKPPRAGDLSVSGCRMGVEKSCSVTITAVGGAVSWQVAGASEDLRAGGGGRLAAGQSASVTVSRTNGWCWGTKNGSVSFAPGGAASVSYC